MTHTKTATLKFKIIFLVLVSMTLSSVHAQAALTQNDVSQLYVAIFNRASEGGGNAWWQANYEDKTIAASAMLEAEVAQKYFGNALDSDLEFIKHIYKNTLNKTYADDPGGINYWVGELNKGKSRGEVVTAMVGVIKEYAPGGLYHIPDDPVTIAAYNQFTNRVKVSNYMADTLVNPPANWETTTQFGPGGLNVTFNGGTVDTAKQAIDIFAGSPAGLVDDIEYYMAMITSAGEMSPMLDEISFLLEAVLSGDSSVVTITPPLDTINPYSPPQTITITANFGAGYTPAGSTSVYTGNTVVNITNITFGGTGLNANATLTASDVRRDGVQVLNGVMTFGINIGMSGGNTSITATASFTNLASVDAQINGNVSLSIPAINDNTGQLTLPATLTLNQLSAMDYLLNGTVTLTQVSAEIYDVNFNITTNQGPVSGILRAQLDVSNPDQIILSTPFDPMTVGTATLVVNQVTVDIGEASTCTDLPVSGNIVVTQGTETATINFSNCNYTVN